LVHCKTGIKINYRTKSKTYLNPSAAESWLFLDMRAPMRDKAASATAG
jgi:hypothetical protein